MSDCRTPVPPQLLRFRVDPAGFDFASTDELEPYLGVLGQERAQAAIEFGVAMQRPGYNIFVMGDPGCGRLSLVTHYLQTRAHDLAVPSDWLYLNNFADIRQPLALELPAGQGKSLVADMEAFVDNLMATFPTAFENPAFQRGKQAIELEFNQRYNRAIDDVEAAARAESIALFREGDSVSFSPMLGGEPVSEEEFAGFPEEEREAFHATAKRLEKSLNDALMALPQWKRESSERLRQLQQDTITQAVEPLLAGLAETYGEAPALLRYLEDARHDLLRTVAEMLMEDRPLEGRDEVSKRQDLVNRYCPKLLVSHAGEDAPVVYEPNPTYGNLFGRVEYVNEQGALVTHYKLIYPGAVHQANGGYLILDAEKLVSEPHVWPALKRALKNRQIRIEAPQQDPGQVAVVTLNPEEIPLRVKIVLIGDAELYYVMQALDDEFNELFRVLADFDDHLTRDAASTLDLARLIKAHADETGCPALTAAAVARLVEVSIRDAGHTGRLSARIGDLFELVGEADLLRGREGSAQIDQSHVESALQLREQRLGRISQQLREEVLEGRVLIDTAGSAVGKINGLTVLEVGDCRFGMPARITATLYPGTRGVVDIEREVLLGQAIHSKGIMILSGYLGHRYARDFPLAVSANIAIEQSYGYVDGDSASLAEVCALISALTGIPIRQCLATTGSINQYGEVQAVGGVNEKIEGFFRLCAERGFHGGHGVIIPKANLNSLMLEQEVVDAAARGDFSVYAVDSVDEALALLTGIAAATVNAKAVSKLRSLSRLSGNGRVRPG
jgi:lon-related putative ATP-dependent protease